VNKLLAAKKLDDAIYEPIPELPQEEVMHHRPKSRVTPRFFKFLYVSAVVCLFCSGLYFCSLALGIATKGYEINQLKKEISDLETTNERLRLEIVRLDSLERVEMVAYNELGMKKPETEDYLLLPGVESPAWSVIQGNDMEIASVEEAEPTPENPNNDNTPLFRQKAAGFLAMALDRE
jgi:cell division protein FtsL